MNRRGFIGGLVSAVAALVARPKPVEAITFPTVADTWGKVEFVAVPYHPKFIPLHPPQGGHIGDVLIGDRRIPMFWVESVSHEFLDERVGNG